LQFPTDVSYKLPMMPETVPEIAVELLNVDGRACLRFRNSGESRKAYVAMED